MIEDLTTLKADFQDKAHELTAVIDDLANLLISTDIAAVLLDTDLRIKRFTTVASHVLDLQPSDTGRLMGDIASNLGDVDLSQEARTVLQARCSVPCPSGHSAWSSRRIFRAWRLVPRQAVQFQLMEPIREVVVNEMRWYLEQLRSSSSTEAARFARARRAFASSRAQAMYRCWKQHGRPLSSASAAMPFERVDSNGGSSATGKSG